MGFDSKNHIGSRKFFKSLYLGWTTCLTTESKKWQTTGLFVNKASGYRNNF